ncbi:hypothetical protein CLU79DRAFT_741383 [Phycomyces nitens]|nr:hypothetical protein CLU79DRAFT_741383 [Phycomyces nitens]
MPANEQGRYTQHSKDKSVTAKDIANLYSSLQSVINNGHVTKEPRHQDSISPDHFSAHTPHLRNTLQRSQTAPLPEISEGQSRMSESNSDCPCQHILVSEHSMFCALCDRVIPVVKQLQKEKETALKDIKSLREKIKIEADQAKQHESTIRELSATANNLTKSVRTKTKELQDLKSDMEKLNEKYIGQVDKVIELQLAKDAVESELEELSRKLFEEANGMVANEKREKHKIEVAYKHLQKQLTETQERLSTEELQLNELRTMMSTMDENKSQEEDQPRDQRDPDQRPLHDPDQRAVRDLAGLFADKLAVEPSDGDSLVGVDPMLMGMFIEFAETAARVPLNKIHVVPFLKYSQREGIDPCLRFGPNSRLSVRKLNEAIVMNTCFIEETPAGFAAEQAERMTDVPLKISASKTMLWERLNGAEISTFRGCQACGREDPRVPLSYRFRVSYFDDWACIDRFCRDRMVAVCEFYVFVRNVRQGYYNSRSVQDLYHEMIRLRLQMFYASMGALSETLLQLGVAGDGVGKASAPKMSIPPPTKARDSAELNKPLPDFGDNSSYSSSQDCGSRDGHNGSEKGEECVEPERSTSAPTGNGRSVWA